MKEETFIAKYTGRYEGEYIHQDDVEQNISEAVSEASGSSDEEVFSITLGFDSKEDMEQFEKEMKEGVAKFVSSKK